MQVLNATGNIIHVGAAALIIGHTVDTAGPSQVPMLYLWSEFVAEKEYFFPKEKKRG